MTNSEHLCNCLSQLILIHYKMIQYIEETAPHVSGVR
nr:MAG TPA: hypothetical protein [Caudoviricetes sp.]